MTGKTKKEKTSTAVKRKGSSSLPSRRKGRAVKKRGIKKVWHISRFQQRYELPDDVRFDRKSPLQYTKDFCSGQDDESCSYFRSIMSLRTKTDWLMLQGAFAELKRIAANYSKVYRGYLLDSDFKPASDEQIGCWLGLQNGQIKHVLKELSSVGLIEQVTIPDFKDSGNKKQSGHKKNISRARSRKHERSRVALNKKAKTKVKDKTKAKDKINGADNDREINNNRQEAKETSSALEGQEQVAKPQAKEQGRETTTIVSNADNAPTTTPPIKPKEADLEGAKAINAKAPSGRIKEPTHISHSLNAVRRRCNQPAMQAGHEIYKALGSPWVQGTPESVREITCFASQFERIIGSGLSPPVILSLWESLKQEGERLSKFYSKNGGYSSAAKVWNTIFKKKLAKARNGIS